MKKSALRYVLFGVLCAVLLLSSCGGKEKDSAAGGSEGMAGQSGAGSSDAAAQAAQDAMSQYGIDLPEGVISLADPEAVYEKGDAIQFNSMELFMRVDDASDWIESAEGLSEGEKYISIAFNLYDYGAGTVKQIPAPEHYYLIEAKDAEGNPVALPGGTLRPVTDFPKELIRKNADGYYTEARGYGPYDMDVWLLYRVPEPVREVVLAVWTQDQFSQPHDVAFRLKIYETIDKHTFENWSLEEILQAVQTTERPELEEFHWFSPYVIRNGFGWSFSTGYPPYDGRAYEGGWKCYMINDQRSRGPGLDAHLLNLYVENFVPDKSEYSSDGLDWSCGYADIRLDWYLAFDGDGNVTDESSRPDTVIPHERFEYNRFENPEDTTPFLSFSFNYAFDRAVGRGYYDVDKDTWYFGVVRKDGYGIWMIDEENEADPGFISLPGTYDAPLPKGLPVKAASQSTQGALPETAAQSTQTTVTETAAQNTQAAASDTASQNSPGNYGNGLASAGTSAGQSFANGQGMSGSSSGSSAGTSSLDEFHWYFEDAFPAPDSGVTELQDVGGSWKSLINLVLTDDAGSGECTILTGDMDVQYMGYRLTVIFTSDIMYSFDLNTPEDILETPLDPDDRVTMTGDWGEDPGYMDIYDEESGLNLFILNFSEDSGMQYALGEVYLTGEEEPVGEVALMRKK